MDIIYMGLMFCDDSLKDEFKTKRRKVSMAPHKFQTNLIRGIDEQEGINLSVINVPPTGSFPANNKKLFSKQYRWGRDNQQISYINLPWIKHKIQEKKLYKCVKGKIKQSRATFLMVYSLYEPFLKVARSVKKENPEIHVCVIHTDAVPGRDDMDKYMTKAAKRRGDRAIKLLRCAESFILLSKNLVDPMEVAERPYLILECICDEKQQLAKKAKRKDVFLYTGEVSREFGLCELAKAFQQTPDLQLWICGDGDARNEIQELCTQTGNIRYFGYVAPEKIKTLQDECAYLINPRRPSGTYTKYSFPSKTAEYMMTGKPVIMYKLEAIPDEYDQYVNYLTEDTPQGIAKEIQSIKNLDYESLLRKAQNGREHMLCNRSANQAGKIVVNFLQRGQAT